MIRINLLPYRAARKKENVRFQLNIFIGSVVLLLLLIYLYNNHLNGRIQNLNADISSTRAQVAKYQEINKEIAEIKRNLEVLDKKIKVIESLERDRRAPVHNMDSLYQLLVEKRMWYTQIEERGETMRVSGIAMDNQTVADYMTRLERSDRFQNIQLAAVRQYTLRGQEGLSLKQFDVNFQKRPIDPDAAEASKQ
ncbi:PilN domain-containing protein [Desulfatitalea alkaliphila]|uniref:PilN domain-containing protein n=1 Tax=Desulfatitalea alkaliphila TaxID=2929485 RepID=A0AA41UL40_9BACT|nr:PilN domain-containing protein [Desulfatitalea alkaliphila]MCJ8502077.1 PilN domain-containing protein [Desulfatitalea alkaliphila]